MRKILASYDDEGIYVYQAFKPSIADEALIKGTFGKGFNLERMTWIKPSFGWMLYRSHYASKHRQERILKIKITHHGFHAILAKGIPTYFEANLFKSGDEWRKALRDSEVRYQWDPDRDIYLHRLKRRALQIGMRGKIVRKYVQKYIWGIEDVTQLAYAIRAAIEKKSKQLPATPIEREYEVNTAIKYNLGMIEKPSALSSSTNYPVT